MPSRQVLESHPVSHLKREISQTNIKGYSKLKKDGIIDLMLKHKDRFHHIQMYKLPERVKKEKPKAEPKAEPKKKVIKKKVVIKEEPKEVEGVITLKEFIEEYKESQENGDLPPKKLTDKEFKEAYEKFLKRPENKPKAKKVEPKKKKIIKKKPEPKKDKSTSLKFDGTSMKDFDEFFRKNF